MPGMSFLEVMTPIARPIRCGAGCGRFQARCGEESRASCNVPAPPDCPGRAELDRPETVDGAKAGFAVRIARWLGGPLRSWAEEYLSESRLRQQGFFRAQSVRKTWQEHISCKRDWGQPLWNMLVFQRWLEAQKLSGKDNEEPLSIREGEGRERRVHAHLVQA